MHGNYRISYYLVLTGTTEAKVPNICCLVGVHVVLLGCLYSCSCLYRVSVRAHFLGSVYRTKEAANLHEWITFLWQILQIYMSESPSCDKFFKFPPVFKSVSSFFPANVHNFTRRVHNPKYIFYNSHIIFNWPCICQYFTSITLEFVPHESQIRCTSKKQVQVWNVWEMWRLRICRLMDEIARCLLSVVCRISVVCMFLVNMSVPKSIHHRNLDSVMVWWESCNRVHCSTVALCTEALCVDTFDWEHYFYWKFFNAGNKSYVLRIYHMSTLRW